MYTKLGPFIDGGAPYLSAATFNHLEDALTATAPNAAVNAVTGWFHADAYGAAPAATPTVNRTAIQAAITAANTAYTATGTIQTVYLPAVYPVDVTPFFHTDGTTQSGFTALLLLDGVHLTGRGGITAKNSAYTASDLTGSSYGALIRSRSLSHARISQITVDGNTAGQTVTKTGSNIELWAVQDVEVSGTRQLNANLNGIRIISTSTTTAVCTNIRINGNIVETAGGIGLQCSNFDGLQILDNRVQNTGDNCIDVYGENGTTTVAGTNFEIANNIVRSGMTGVFLETIGFGSAHHNRVIGCTSTGVWVNRINGKPAYVTVDHNTISGTPTGLKVLGDTSGVILDSNTVYQATTACVQLGSGTGSVSYVYMNQNVLDGNDGTTPLVLYGGAQATNLWIRGTKSRTSSTLPTNPAATTSNTHVEAVNT